MPPNPTADDNPVPTLGTAEKISKRAKEDRDQRGVAFDVLRACAEGHPREAVRDALKMLSVLYGIETSHHRSAPNLGVPARNEGSA